jgi:hypothetical protein
MASADRGGFATRLVERLSPVFSAKGASAQMAVAGAYAWAVTVEPAMAEPGAPFVARLAAAAALVALVAGSAGWGGRNALRWRVASLWGFVSASALAWLAAPGSVRPIRFDSLRGLAGMAGWALFALASAGPALGDRRAEDHVVDDDPLEPRRRLAGGDSAYVIVGSVLALALQGVGWDVASSERALLVRVVALAAGLGLVGAAAEVSLARHAVREHRRSAVRVRRALPTLAMLGALLLAGLLLLVRG